MASTLCQKWLTIFVKKLKILYRLCQKKLYNFQFFIVEKEIKAQQQHSGSQKHNCPVCKKIFKWYHSMVRSKSYGQWHSKDVRGPWTTDSPGPLPILHNIIPLTPPPHTPLLRLCTCLQWCSKDVPGPMDNGLSAPILHNLIPLTLPHIHPYSDFAHVYLYYMISNTALFDQYTSHGVLWKFGSL